MNALAKEGEFGLIERIRARFRQPTAPDYGIGDDCALLTPRVGMQIAVSTDLMTEGVHFDRSYMPAIALGRKALAVNLSDLAAMGAIPRVFFLSFALPRAFSVDYLDGVLEGLAAMADEHDCLLAGGDTCGSQSGLTISITVLGEQKPQYMVKRSGAQAGHDIWVSGTLGDAAAGLEQLQKGAVACDQFLVSRHLDPAPRVGLGIVLAESESVSSMIDISDGLYGDVGHCMRLSGVGAAINLNSLPLSLPYRTFSRQQHDPWLAALTGGEDYELCFTAAPQHEETICNLAKTTGIPVTKIGTVTEQSGVTLYTADGSPYQPERSSYTHF